MKRTDYQIEQIDGWEDDIYFLVKKRIFWLGFIPSRKFRYIMSETGDSPVEEFKSNHAAEKYIQSLINN